MDVLTFHYQNSQNSPDQSEDAKDCEFTAQKAYQKVKLGCWISPNYVEKIQNFQTKDTDIILAAYPRSGTNFTRQILMAIMDKVNGLPVTAALDDPDYEIKERSSFIEFEDKNKNLVEFENLENMLVNEKTQKWLPKKSKRRIITTHLPAFLAPNSLTYSKFNSKTKTIVVTRNPLDVCVSYYHSKKKEDQKTKKINDNSPDVCPIWSVRLKQDQADFKKFYEMFVQFDDKQHSNELVYGNWIDWHNTWIDFSRSNKNTLFIHYEDLIRNFENTILKIANFINKDVNDIDIFEDIVKELENYKIVSNVENMAKQLNDKIGSKFIRKGKIGDSMKYFDEEMKQKMVKDCEELLDFNFYKTIQWPWPEWQPEDTDDAV